MKIYHYSPQEIKQLYKYEDQTNIKEYFERGVGKPYGLWVSIEDRKSEGWKLWCENEEYEIERLKYKYKVTLFKKRNILHLKTSKEIFDFTDQYKKHDDFYPSILTDKIDWPLIMTKYQGIIIAPYQWECRLHSKTIWYYGWDCASGCIWDIDCIKKFELVNE